MAETGDRFYVRRTTGDLIGPLSKDAIADLLSKGQLDGGEEVSPDRRRWQPIAQLIPEAPAPPDAATNAPGGDAAGSPASSSWGERDLGEVGGLELAPLDAALGQPLPPPPEPMVTAPDVASPPGLAPVDLSTLAPLELEGETPASEPAPAGATTPQPGGEPTAATDGSTPLIVDDAAPPAEAPSPASAPLIGFETGPSSGVGLMPAPTTAAGEIGAGAAAPASSVPTALAARGRTLTAAKPRAEEPSARPRKPLIIGAAATLVVAAVAVAFLVFDLGDHLIAEPAPAAILGDAAAGIAADKYVAYQRGVTLLLDEINRRPRTAALRAAAAELLAEFVVLHHGERARTARADATLAEIPPHPFPSAATAPTLLRARAWIALAKGRTREAGRVLEEGALVTDPSPEHLLLDGWIALGQRKPAVAESAFKQGLTQFPNRVAFRFGLARAQEESGQAAPAAAAYKDVLAASPGHFEAALGLIRTGGYPPDARITLANRLLADSAGNGSAASQAEALAIIARALAAQGKTGEAAAAIDKAVSKDATNPAALVAAGEALLAQGRLHDAVAKFATALPGAPAIPAAVPAHELRFAIAAVLIENGHRPDGLALLDPPAAKRQTTTVDPRAAFWRGRAAELQTPPDLTAAARSYEETLAANPRFVPASLQLGALLLKQSRTAEAVGVLKRAQAAGAAPAMLQVALGQAQLTAGDNERARKTFKDVLAQNPKDPTARLGLATALEAAHDPSGARRELESLLADDPGVPELRPRLARLLVAAGERGKALALYQAEIDAGKASFAARLAAAKLSFEMGHAPAASALLEKLVADAPQTPGALLWLGKVRLAGGDVAGALADLRRALAFESTPELHYEHGRALAAGGSEEKALAEYEQAGALPEAMVARGRLLVARGDTDHAVPILEAAVKVAPGNGDGWMLLGSAYDRIGATAKAVAAWRAAAHAAPDNGEVAYHLGRWEMDQGQVAAAVGHLRQAAAKAPPGVQWLSDLYYQLGVAEKSKGARAAAVAAFKKYLTLAPAEAPSRHEVQQQLVSLGAAP
ncbi:MAG TPA: tetratricopeptide repeat protein [Polyangia bacterium]|nr:tetratricopeptide repeat protein [Polyangia bacterium]